MTTFDERVKGFENKFAHDKELNFKAMALRNRWLGRWAAQKLGKDGDAADQYATAFVMSDIGSGGHVVDKLLVDFGSAQLSVTPKDIHIEMERLTPLAMAQIMGTSQAIN